MKEITERTFIPISLVITLLGGVVWLTTLNAKTDVNLDSFGRVEKKQDAYFLELKEVRKEMQETNSRLSRLEGMLKNAHRQIPDSRP